MSDKDPREKEAQPGGRRAFLRRFFKKSAPLVVGAVARPLSKLPALVPSPLHSEPKSLADLPAAEADTLSEELKKEFEQTHEEFIKNNPDFFEKP